MTQALHSQARTIHLIREEIGNSTLPQAELARLDNGTRQTIRKWHNCETPEDKSHCPDKMYTTLSPEQELIIVELRRTPMLPTDDLLAVTREFINRAASRAGLGRCLGHRSARLAMPILNPFRLSFDNYEIQIKCRKNVPHGEQQSDTDPY